MHPPYIALVHAFQRSLQFIRASPNGASESPKVVSTEVSCLLGACGSVDTPIVVHKRGAQNPTVGHFQSEWQTRGQSYARVDRLGIGAAYRSDRLELTVRVRYATATKWTSYF